MRTRAIFMILITVSLNCSYSTAQRFSEQVPHLKKFSQAEIFDQENGITIFDKLHPWFGDSVRFTKDGYNAQGWLEEHYVNGKLLHRGFYKEGRLYVFKNYFENGMVERDLRMPDDKTGFLELYTDKGKSRLRTEYFEGKVAKKEVFDEDGRLTKTEQMDPATGKLIKQSLWRADGKLSSETKMSDPVKHTYLQKNYFDNGKLKESGTVIFNEGGFNRQGAWDFYSEKGKKLKTENY